MLPAKRTAEVMQVWNVRPCYRGWPFANNFRQEECHVGLLLVRAHSHKGGPGAIRSPTRESAKTHC